MESFDIIFYVEISDTKSLSQEADHMLHYTKIQYIFNIRLQQLFIVSVHLHIHLPQYGRKLSGKTNLITIDFSL